HRLNTCDVGVHKLASRDLLLADHAGHRDHGGEDRLISLRLRRGEGKRGSGEFPACHSHSTGFRHPPVSDSICAAAARTTSSAQGRPTICTPMGSPGGAVPARTTAAGQPVMLYGFV